jgi:hypothetical protein
VNSWGGDHPDGPIPQGIPGFRPRKRGKHERKRGCLALAGWCVLAGLLGAVWLFLAFVLAVVS